MEPQAQEFETQIEDINSQFLSTLDDLKRYYVAYNQRPESNELQNHFSNSQNALQNINNKILTLTTNIQSKIFELNNQNIKQTSEINSLKKKYKDLVKLKKELDKTEDGSDQFIKDSKELYNQQYNKNLVLFLGLLFLSSFCIKSFSNNNFQNIN